MTDFTKEPCLSCKNAKASIKNVADLYEKLLKCEACKKKEVQNEQKGNMSITKADD